VNELGENVVFKLRVTKYTWNNFFFADFFSV